MASTVEGKHTGGKAEKRVHPQIQSSPGLGRDRYLFASDDELANREQDSDNSALHPPPRFQQIVAKDTGKDANAPNGPVKNSHFKFSGGIGPTD